MKYYSIGLIGILAHEKTPISVYGRMAILVHEGIAVGLASMQASYLTAKDRRRKGGVGAVGGFLVFFLMMRFVGLMQGARRGAGPFIWALGLLVLFIAAVTYWRKYSSRDDSD